jgi:hypothetical protein
MTPYGKVTGRYDDPQPDDPELTEEVMDSITKVARKILKEKEKANQELERKLQKIVNKRNPTGSSIRTRRGVLAKNKKDLATVDTEKGNDDLAVLTAKAIGNTTKIATYGHEIATSGTEYMYSIDDALPPELHGYGRALVKCSVTSSRRRLLRARPCTRRSR